VKLATSVWDWKTGEYELVEDGKALAGFVGKAVRDPR
jgi:hypothetical protein